MSNKKSHFTKGVSLPQMLVYLTLALMMGFLLYKHFYQDRCDDGAGLLGTLFQGKTQAAVAEPTPVGYDPFRDRPKVGKPQMPKVIQTAPTPETVQKIDLPPPPTQPTTQAKVTQNRVVRKRT